MRPAVRPARRTRSSGYATGISGLCRAASSRRTDCRPEAAGVSVAAEGSDCRRRGGASLTTRLRENGKRGGGDVCHKDAEVNLALSSRRRFRLSAIGASREGRRAKEGRAARL